MSSSSFETIFPPLDSVDYISNATREIAIAMDEKSYARAVNVFSSLRPPDQADVMSGLTRTHQEKILSWMTPRRLGNRPKIAPRRLQEVTFSL